MVSLTSQKGWRLPQTRVLMNFQNHSSTTQRTSGNFRGRMELASDSSALYNPFKCPFLIPFKKINKCNITCDFQDAYHYYGAHHSSCPSVLPFWPPQRNLGQQPWEQKVRATSQLKSYVIVWRLLKKDGNGILAKIFCFLEIEIKSGSEAFCFRFFPNLRQTCFLVKDFIRHCSI